MLSASRNSSSLEKQEATNAHDIQRTAYAARDKLWPRALSAALNIGDNLFRPSEKIGINDHA